MITDEQIKAVFSANLKRLMSEHDKNQVDLIRDLGFKRATVSEWVNGRKYPRMDKVQLLADYFMVKVTDLVGEPGDYAAKSFNKRTPNIDERFNYFIEELNLRNDKFLFEGIELEDDDIDLLRLMTSNMVAIYRASLKNKYKGERE